MSAHDLGEFPTFGDGEWVRPVHRGFLMGCCGCGLVHRVDFRVRPGLQVEMRAYVDDEATAALRAREAKDNT